MALKTPVLLSNIRILDIHADVGDVHILVMACIDQADLPVVLVIDDSVAEHGEIRSLHLGQLVVSNYPALVQFRFHLSIDKDPCQGPADQPCGKYCQEGMKKPSEYTQYGHCGIADAKENLNKDLLL